MTDNYTKGLLERAKERSKALGLSGPKFSLSGFEEKENKASESNLRQSASASPKKTTYSSPKKSYPSSPNKKPSSSSITPSKKPSSSSVTPFSPSKLLSASKFTIDKLDLKAGSTATVSNNVNKEDADVAVEVNITSNQNIQVEVEVAEYEMDDDGNILKKIESSSFESSASIRDSSRKNLKRLEALYSENEQVGSPIQRTEEKFCAEDHHQNGSRPLKKFSKLAALADNINSWEDDYSRHEAHAPTVKGAIPKTQSQIHIQSKSGQDNRHGSPLKNLMWDRKVIDSLEAQGYTRRDSVVPKLVYEYKDKPTTSQTFVPKSTVSPAKNIIVGSPGKTAAGSPSKLATSGSPAKPYQSPVKSYQSPVKPYRSPAKVSSPAKVKTPQKTIMKPQATSKPTTPSKSVSFSNSVKGQKDPAEMSLKERMAIFEKNKGVAPLPKCRFGLAETTTYNAGEGTSKSVLGDLSDKISNFQVHAAEKKKESGVVQDTGASVKGMASILLGKKEMTISEKQISEEIRKQKELDMQTVLNRFQVPPQPQQSQEPEKPKDPKSPRKMEVDDDVELRNKKRRSTEQKQTPEKLRNQEAFQRSDDKKRARVSASRLYPVLSDIESTTDSEMDNYTTATVSGTESAQEGAYHIYSESSTRVCTTNDEDQNDSYEEYSEEEETNLSLGREILKSVKESQENTLNRSYLDSTASSEDISGLDEMDQYLEEALENDISTQSDKADECSDSFEFNRHSNRLVHKVGNRKSGSNSIPVSSKLEINPANDESGKVTLVHTVSFYRRQQSQSANNTPVRKILYKNLDDAADEEMQEKNLEDNKKMKEMVDEKIKKLLNEVCKQQTIIAQTSQALNLCASTVEFSGSTEAVEGERHLLVATHRRQACLNEIQRLKVEGILDRQSVGIERGTLTVSDISVPLKPHYVNKLASDEINGHNLVCLLKYNEHVLATKSVPTMPGLKSVRFPDVLTLNEVFSDFKITLEIYGMTAHREILPHDIKYHITPGKKKHYRKGHESNMFMPPVQSPGGPNAVRTPALCQYGYIIFSIREVKQKSWVINEVAPGVSPLNGNVFLKLDSHITVDVDHSGFLNMFDEISGFGAWHRRWCRLSGNTIYYWKYPEDERKKEPIGKLELTNCITEKVNLAPRNICARLHTVLLEFRRARYEEDQESLIMVPKDNYTIVRQLLAADTKEDREEWCLHLNKALALMKSWGTQV